MLCVQQCNLIGICANITKESTNGWQTGRMGGIAEENNDEANAAQLKSFTIFIQCTLWTFMCICQTVVQCGS